MHYNTTGTHYRGDKFPNPQILHGEITVLSHNTTEIPQKASLERERTPANSNIDKKGCEQAKENERMLEMENVKREESRASACLPSDLTWRGQSASAYRDSGPFHRRCIF